MGKISELFHRDIPHLVTVDTVPMNELEKRILAKQSAIEAWFREKWQWENMPLTCSVDLRNSGFKVAAVDTNLFPAGFNNLSEDSFPLCVQAAQYVLGKYYPNCHRILIIGENHTRNSSYSLSLHRLAQIFCVAGYEVRVGRIDSDFMGDQVKTDLGIMDVSNVKKKDNRLSIQGFDPCIVLLNRDLSEGIPELLTNIEQKIIPIPEMGWYSRLKSSHFEYYQGICDLFARDFDIDVWSIAPYFQQCNNINFLKSHGIEELANVVDELLEKIKNKYTEYGISNKPFVAIKSDSGTYGMGVMMVESSQQLFDMNRKQRVKMSTSKGKQAISRVIVQEGVYSFDNYKRAVAEPVVYLIGHSVVGGFYRIHKNKGMSENLNSPGMEFKPLAFGKPCNTPKADSQPNRFYIYGVIARLALLAAVKEIDGVLGE
ncbi:MAG: glutamate--cysteine ligase [Legionellales bacterium]|nr:glutamate--cysteine ligase [Legionellales bacterium]